MPAPAGSSLAAGAGMPLSPWHAPLSVPVPIRGQLPGAAIANELLPSSASNTAWASGRRRAPVPMMPLPLPAALAVSGATWKTPR
nr:hypothetical protein [Pseudomonas aegrilactucae]